jgi:hypothetical protein
MQETSNFKLQTSNFKQKHNSEFINLWRKHKDNGGNMCFLTITRYAVCSHTHETHTLCLDHIKCEQLNTSYFQFFRGMGRKTGSPFPGLITTEKPQHRILGTRCPSCICAKSSLERGKTPNWEEAERVWAEETRRGREEEQRYKSPNGGSDGRNEKVLCQKQDLGQDLPSFAEEANQILSCGNGLEEKMQQLCSQREDDSSIQPPHMMAEPPYWQATPDLLTYPQTHEPSTILADRRVVRNSSEILPVPFLPPELEIVIPPAIPPRDPRRSLANTKYIYMKKGEEMTTHPTSEVESEKASVERGPFDILEDLYNMVDEAMMLWMGIWSLAE